MSLSLSLTFTTHTEVEHIQDVALFFPLCDVPAGNYPYWRHILPLVPEVGGSCLVTAKQFSLFGPKRHLRQDENTWCCQLGEFLPTSPFSDVVCTPQWPGPLGCGNPRSPTLALGSLPDIPPYIVPTISVPLALHVCMI